MTVIVFFRDGRAQVIEDVRCVREGYRCIEVCTADTDMESSAIVKVEVIP